MTIEIRRAEPRDIPSLIVMLSSAYGQDYALPFGYDEARMTEALSRETDVWLVVTDGSHIIGAAMAELDLEVGVARFIALVVHPRYRKQELGMRVGHEARRLILEEDGRISSMFVNVHASAPALGRLPLRDGWAPGGIHPEGVRYRRDRDTLLLFLKHAPGVLERRKPVEILPEKVMPLWRLVRAAHALPDVPREIPTHPELPKALPLEMITAPHFVQRRAAEVAPGNDPPFAKADTLAVTEDGTCEMFFHINRKGHFGLFAGANKPLKTLPLANTLFRLLKSAGAEYVEATASVFDLEGMEALLNAGFLPCAYYPALWREDDAYVDGVTMCRMTWKPDLKDLKLPELFQPYLEQYAALAKISS